MANSRMRLVAPITFFFAVLSACAEPPVEFPRISGTCTDIIGFDSAPGFNFLGGFEVAEAQLDGFCEGAPNRLLLENADGVEVLLSFLLPGEQLGESDVQPLRMPAVVEPLIVAWKFTGRRNSFILSDTNGIIVASQFGLEIEGLTSEFSVAPGPPAALPSANFCGSIQATSLLLGPSDAQIELAIGESQELDELTIAHNRYSGMLRAHGPCAGNQSGFQSWLSVHRPSAFGP